MKYDIKKIYYRILNKELELTGSRLVPVGKNGYFITRLSGPFGSISIEEWIIKMQSNE